MQWQTIKQVCKRLNQVVYWIELYDNVAHNQLNTGNSWDWLNGWQYTRYIRANRLVTLCTSTSRVFLIGYQLRSNVEEIY